MLLQAPHDLHPAEGLQMTGSLPMAPPLHTRGTSQACRAAVCPQHGCSHRLPVALVRRALAVPRRANTTASAKVHQDGREFNPNACAGRLGARVGTGKFGIFLLMHCKRVNGVQGQLSSKTLFLERPHWPTWQSQLQYPAPFQPQCARKSTPAGIAVTVSTIFFSWITSTT